ncbi:hypothetical protein CWI39_1275p0010, partial [Hamiltosporidium magnivora]
DNKDNKHINTNNNKHTNTNNNKHINTNNNNINQHNNNNTHIDTLNSLHISIFNYYEGVNDSIINNLDIVYVGCYLLILEFFKDKKNFHFYNLILVKYLERMGVGDSRGVVSNMGSSRGSRGKGYINNNTNITSINNTSINNPYTNINNTPNTNPYITSINNTPYTKHINNTPYINNPYTNINNTNNPNIPNTPNINNTTPLPLSFLHLYFNIILQGSVNELENSLKIFKNYKLEGFYSLELFKKLWNNFNFRMCYLLYEFNILYCCIFERYVIIRLSGISNNIEYYSRDRECDSDICDSDSMCDSDKNLDNSNKNLYKSNSSKSKSNSNKNNSYKNKSSKSNSNKSSNNQYNNKYTNQYTNQHNYKYTDVYKTSNLLLFIINVLRSEELYFMDAFVYLNRILRESMWYKGSDRDIRYKGDISNTIRDNSNTIRDINYKGDISNTNNNINTIRDTYNNSNTYNNTPSYNTPLYNTPSYNTLSYNTPPNIYNTSDANIFLTCLIRIKHFNSIYKFILNKLKNACIESKEGYYYDMIEYDIVYGVFDCLINMFEYCNEFIIFLRSNVYVQGDGFMVFLNNGVVNVRKVLFSSFLYFVINDVKCDLGCGDECGGECGDGGCYSKDSNYKDSNTKYNTKDSNNYNNTNYKNYNNHLSEIRRVRLMALFLISKMVDLNMLESQEIISYDLNPFISFIIKNINDVLIVWECLPLLKILTGNEQWVSIYFKKVFEFLVVYFSKKYSFFIFEILNIELRNKVVREVVSSNMLWDMDVCVVQGYFSYVFGNKEYFGDVLEKLVCGCFRYVEGKVGGGIRNYDILIGGSIGYVGNGGVSDRELREGDREIVEGDREIVEGDREIVEGDREIVEGDREIKDIRREVRDNKEIVEDKNRDLNELRKDNKEIKELRDVRGNNRDLNDIRRDVKDKNREIKELRKDKNKEINDVKKTPQTLLNDVLYDEYSTSYMFKGLNIKETSNFICMDSLIEEFKNINFKKCVDLNVEPYILLLDFIFLKENILFAKCLLNFKCESIILELNSSKLNLYMIYLEKFNKNIEIFPFLCKIEESFSEERILVILEQSINILNIMFLGKSKNGNLKHYIWFLNLICKIKMNKITDRIIEIVIRILENSFTVFLRTLDLQNKKKENKDILLLIKVIRNILENINIERYSLLFNNVVYGLLRQRNYLYSESLGILGLLKNWKKDFFDFFCDQKFFNDSYENILIKKNLICSFFSGEYEKIDELYNRMEQGFFVSKETDSLNKCSIIRRIAFLVFCLDKKIIYSKFPPIIEIISEFITNTSSNIKKEIIFLIKIILIKIDTEKLSHLWPLIFCEIFNEKEDLEVECETVRLIDIIFTFNLEETVEMLCDYVGGVVVVNDSELNSSFVHYLSLKSGDEQSRCEIKFEDKIVPLCKFIDVKSKSDLKWFYENCNQYFTEARIFGREVDYEWIEENVLYEFIEK